MLLLCARAGSCPGGTGYHQSRRHQARAELKESPQHHQTGEANVQSFTQSQSLQMSVNKRPKGKTVFAPWACCLTLLALLKKKTATTNDKNGGCMYTARDAHAVEEPSNTSYSIVTLSVNCSMTGHGSCVCAAGCEAHPDEGPQRVWQDG